MDGAVNPRSPLDLKPDPDVLMSHAMHHYGQSSGGSMMAPPSPELMASGSMVRYTSVKFLTVDVSLLLDICILLICNYVLI